MVRGLVAGRLVVVLRAGLDERFEAVLANIWLVTKTDTGWLFQRRAAWSSRPRRLETERQYAARKKILGGTTHFDVKTLPWGNYFLGGP